MKLQWVVVKPITGLVCPETNTCRDTRGNSERFYCYYDVFDFGRDEADVVPGGSGVPWKEGCLCITEKLFKDITIYRKRKYYFLNVYYLLLVYI